MNLTEPTLSPSSRRLITGRYSSGQFVLVYGQDSHDKLKLIGCFGEDLAKAKRKEYNRRGPLDRQLTDLDLDTQTEPVIVLTLHEAFFLAYALGCFSLHFGGKETFDLKFCWNLFRDYHIHSNLQLDFAVEYGVYHYFRTRGWIVKSGTNYGVNFLLYKEGPSIDHARYAIIIINVNKDLSVKSNRWNSILTYHRVVQSVCKELLLVFVVTPDETEFTFEKPSSIKKLKLTTRIFTSQSNFPNKISDAQSSRM